MQACTLARTCVRASALARSHRVHTHAHAGESGVRGWGTWMRATRVTPFQMPLSSWCAQPPRSHSRMTPAKKKCIASIVPSSTSVSLPNVISACCHTTKDTPFKHHKMMNANHDRKKPFFKGSRLSGAHLHARHWGHSVGPHLAVRSHPHSTVSIHASAIHPAASAIP